MVDCNLSIQNPKNKTIKSIMFTGGDSNEGINSLSQFGSYGFVNQAAVSNAMAAGQNIDWAQLAQQWIQMRDNTGTDIKKAIPPPNISSVKNANICKSSKFEEKGMADMDMDDEDQMEDKIPLKNDNKNSSVSIVQQQSINQPWFMDQATSTTNIASRSSGPNQWNVWANHDGLPQPPNQVANTNRSLNPTAHIPSLLKITVPHPNEIRAMPDVPNQQDNSSNVMDAAKRKGLPAWIREGLEKMEREKQKQMEHQLKDKPLWYSSEDDADPVNSPKNIIVKSLITKYVAGNNEDDESTDNEASTGENRSHHITAIKNRDENLQYEEEAKNTVGKSYEHKLADLMVVVRRTLTELLLEVTNEEISKVADETIKSFKSKASSAQVIRKSALSTITGKLGLAAYGDSSSDANSDDDEHDSSKHNYQSESDNDSEEEIKNAIRSKRRAFAKISDEIEECVASAAVREEEKLKYFLCKEEEEERENKHKTQERLQNRDTASADYSGHSIGKGYERDFGETTETKLQHLNGKRQKDRGVRKERTTRFSDNKDKTFVALAATASFISNMNATANAESSNKSPTLTNNNQRKNIPDVNGILPNCTNAGMTDVLNAADAALEMALKRKSPEKSDRRRNRDHNRTSSKRRERRGNSKDPRSRSLSSSSTTSSSSSTSTDSDSTSRSSHNSKRNHCSSTKHKSHRSNSKKSEKSPRDHRDDRKYTSSSSIYAKRDRELSSSRYHRHVSSDSDEYYSRRKYYSHYSRNSSHSRTHTSSRRDRDHSRSRSRSSYSSSSNRRH